MVIIFHLFNSCLSLILNDVVYIGFGLVLIFVYFELTWLVKVLHDTSASTSSHGRQSFIFPEYFVRYFLCVSLNFPVFFCSVFSELEVSQPWLTVTPAQQHKTTDLRVDPATPQLVQYSYVNSMNMHRTPPNSSES